MSWINSHPFAGFYCTLAYLIHFFLLSQLSHLSIFHLYAVVERALRVSSNSMRLVDTYYYVKEPAAFTADSW